MELGEVIPISELKKIVEEIYNKFGFTGAVYKPDNFILVKSDKMANQLCPTIKSNQNSVVICSSAQQVLARNALETKKPAIGECDAGFTKFVIPIFFNDEFLGTIGGCGCLVGDKASVDTFYIAKLMGKNEEEIKALAKNISRISEEKLKEVVTFVQESILSCLKKAK